MKINTPSVFNSNYYQLIFAYVLQRNRFLAFPWLLWSLFELLYTLGVTIFLIAIWHGVSFVFNCYLLPVNYQVKSIFGYVKVGTSRKLKLLIHVNLLPP